MRKTKQHNFFKVIIILISVVMGIGINALSLLIVKDENNIGQLMLDNLVEIIVISVIVFIWAKVFPRYFPATNDFRFRKPNIYQVMMILGIVLINMIGFYRLLYLIRGGETNVIMIPFSDGYDSTKEFFNDMVASIHAILIAPVLEEMGFRIIPASVVQTKKRRVVTLIILAVFFALIHRKNFWAVLMDAIVTCILFLCTNNPLIPILYHAFSNFLKTIVMVVSYYGIIDVNMANGGPIIILFSNLISIVGVLVGMALIIPIIFNSNKIRKKKV